MPTRAALEHLVAPHHRGAEPPPRRARPGSATPASSERREAVSALVRAVHDGRRLPGAGAARRGQVPVPADRGAPPPTRSPPCSRRARATQPLLVATALCHLGTDVPRRDLEPARSRPNGLRCGSTLQSDPEHVGDADRDVRARSTRPDRASPLTRYRPVRRGMCSPMRPPGSTSACSAAGAVVDSSSCCTAREHQHRAEHVEADEHRRNRLGVLHVAEDSLRDHRRDRERRRVEHDARRARSARARRVVTSVSTTSRSTDAPWTRARSVIGMFRRLASRSPPCGPAAVTSVPSDHDADRPHVHDAHERSARVGATTGTRGPSGSRARCRHPQRDAHEREREQEVAHHAHPRELHLDRDAAEDRLAPEEPEEDPRRAARGRGAGVGAGTRPSTVRPSGIPIGAREDAIDLLDRGVVRGDAHELGRAAVGPVAASEAGVGEPHDRAAHDDRDEEHEVHGREPAERARRHAGHAHRRQCRKGGRPCICRGAV